MNQNCRGKTVFISGASSGIGLACAEVFAAGGAKLLLCARRTDLLRQQARELEEKYNAEVFAFELDVQDRRAIEKAWNSLDAKWQEVDVLVNNAGLAAGKDKFFEADIDDWEKMIDTNVKGLLYLSRLVAPGMISRGRGHIINIGSISGYEPYEGGSVYCGTKFMVRALSRAFKMDLQGTPVRVSSVDPGAVETDFSLVRFKGDADKAADVYDGMNPLTAADVADAVYYCATRPPHVNISQMLMLATDQASAYHVHRRK